MKQSYKLETLLSAAGQTQEDRLPVFALVNLGFIESLAHGLVSAAEAVSQLLYFPQLPIT